MHVPDRPGVLAGITQALGAARINIEDFELHHMSRERGGTLTLLVSGERDARRASERRSEQRDAGNELRNEEHVEPEALEPRLRLTHARIGRERDAAQYPHDPVAVTPAGDVPRDVGDDAPCQRHREHCDRGQFSPGREPSGNDQRRHGRQRNPDLLDEHVAEDDCQSVLTDDGREVVGHRCARGLRRISISLSVPK